MQHRVAATQRCVKRILLVEDRDLVRQAVSQALAERGFEVAGLTHWCEALLRVGRCVDDAILLDGSRQRDDLLTRVGEVRQRGAHHIYVSGLVAAEDGDAVARAGASFCWFGPMTPDALAMSIRLLAEKVGGAEICVGPFGVVTRSAVLRRSDGRVLPLRPQAFTMLYELARRPGRI